MFIRIYELGIYHTFPIPCLYLPYTLPIPSCLIKSIVVSLFFSPFLAWVMPTIIPHGINGLRSARSFCTRHFRCLWQALPGKICRSAARRGRFGGVHLTKAGPYQPLVNLTSLPLGQRLDELSNYRCGNVGRGCRRDRRRRRG